MSGLEEIILLYAINSHFWLILTDNIEMSIKLPTSQLKRVPSSEDQPESKHYKDTTSNLKSMEMQYKL